MKKKLVNWFWEVDKNDVGIVGGKGANTGEMVKAGFPVPLGFIVTAKAYFQFIEENKLAPKIKKYLAHCDLEDPRSLDQTEKVIKRDILQARIPKEISQEIVKYYFELGALKSSSSKKINFLDKLKSSFNQPLVAARSSATAEDLPEASFAGQQETYLNVKGEANVVQAVKKCWASLFESRAIFYRNEQKFDHLKVGIAVLVQKMIQSDTSGVMFTIDPVTNDKKNLVIESVYGLGEYIVQGKVEPDFYKVRKYDLQIMEKQMGQQEIAFKRDSHGKTREMKIKKDLQKKQKITGKQIIALAQLGRELERHYYFPQDIEWAIEKNKIYILQTRPVTTLNNQTTKQPNKKMTQEKTEKLPMLLKGDPASPGMVSGPAMVIKSAKEIYKVKKGQVLVAPQTNPDFVPAMKKAVAIVTEKGGRTSHAAIVSRELGVPCVVGAQNATKIIKKNLVITVNGQTGEVFKGGWQIKSSVPQTDVSEKEEKKPDKLLKTATKVYTNLAVVERAQEVARMNVGGVGLLRAEFMIADIGYHPKKLIRDKKQNFFIDKLSANLAVFCQAFSPRPVVYRATDFKTTEYRNLIGGKAFEPHEENPMLGFRGAFRYLAQPEVFNLELEAIKKVRNKMGFKNLWLMLPFVRTVKELQEVKKMISAQGLNRSSNFKIWLMVEIPANVILLDKFLKVGVDGVSIGSNDLTQLILGVDRDNSELAAQFNEQDEAVLWALEKIIKTCQKTRVTSSICGQAPSDYPDLVEKLVKWGITSVSVAPDAVDRTRETIYKVERKLIK
ncbi:phosphoenolpyruvate synthase [Candidatus Microgenomates bacterium]|nr:phosphoenolpyruvate synthase [Candidatus Microgenomates bacterium]